MLRRRQRLADKYVGKGPVDMKAISRKNENDIFLGAPREVDPGVALLEEVHRTAGHVAYLSKKVQELNDESLIWNKTMESEEDLQGGEASYAKKIKEHRNEVSRWYDLYERERKHLASVANAALKAGVEERRVRLAERGVDTLEAAITAALQDLGVDPYTTRARAAISKRLREALVGADDLFGYSGGGEVLREAQAVSAAPTVIDVDPYWVDSEVEEF
jgi:hypothetical protein